jgi:hypothetical protein
MFLIFTGPDLAPPPIPARFNGFAPSRLSRFSESPAGPQIGKVVAWQFDAMQEPEMKSNRQPPNEPDDPWSWIAIIFAAVLALVLVIQTSPAMRGTSDDPPVEAKSG